MSRARPWHAVLLGALALAGLSLFKHYSLDEFQYSHAAWLVSQGEVPHRDFFEFHFALPYQALSPLFLLPGAGPETVRLVRLGMLAVLLVLVWAMATLQRERGKLALLIAPLLLATAPSFALRGTEIRPDPFAFALYLAAVACFTVLKRPLVAGLLLGLAVLCTQKVLLYGAPFAVALGAELFARRHRAAFFFLAGVTAPLAAQLLWLVSTRSLEPWWAQTWTFAVEHERAYPGFPFTRYLWPALAQQPTLFALALLGAVDAGRRREWLLVGSFATTLFSFAFARAPFPYALVPFAALAALFAARGVGWLFERSRPTALALLAVTVVHGAFGLFRDAAPSNRAQHEVLAKLNDLTAPTDPVFDCSGQASARPHVGFRYYTNALIHRDEATTLGQRIAAELRAAGCTATLRDARFEWLPEDARAFVTAHFQPVDGDLSLWGQRYPAEAPPQTFEAVRTGTYFVEPADAALTLDGRDLDAATFTLERGSHRVEYRGPPRELFILWLPANKARWRPDFSAKPRFSTVF